MRDEQTPVVETCILFHEESHREGIFDIQLMISQLLETTMAKTICIVTSLMTELKISSKSMPSC